MKKRMVLISMLSIVIVAVSWLLNMGWIRFFMTFLLIPVVHGTVFFLTNLFSFKYFNESVKIKRLNMFFILTYLIAYILMPDGGDVGEMYFFFGLIHSDTFSYAAGFISNLAFIGHITLFVMQIVEIRELKKNILKGKF